jgi:hypothetical protein
MKVLHLLTPLALCWGAATLAEAPAELPPPPMTEEEEIEPEVKIIKREDKTIEEYRVNGQLYMIKVTPKNAPPYYLIDTNGDGTMEASRTEIEPDLMIPRWVLFRW